jgi:hypothetical protein
MAGESVLIGCIVYFSVWSGACYLANKQQENNIKNYERIINEKINKIKQEQQKRKERLNYNRLD